MDGENMSSDQVRPRWFIDLDWYQSNNRSFFTLAENCLCSECRQRLSVEEGKVSVADLLANIKDCCSRNPDFIAERLSILESVFRIFLANGNQPLDLEEINKLLIKWRGRDAYHTSVETLSRLFKSDRYYGIRQVAD